MFSEDLKFYYELVPLSFFVAVGFFWILLQRIEGNGAKLEKIGFFRTIPKPDYLKYKRWALLPIALSAGFLIIALARPIGGKVSIPTLKSGKDIVILMDVSRSMLANDVLPNRMIRQKEFVRGLLNALTGEKVAVIAFAGKGKILSPLTSDYFFLHRTIDRIDTDTVRSGGTNINEALSFAYRVMFGSGRDDATSREIILISDGENLQSDYLDVVDMLSQAGVVVHAISMGLPSGANVPLETGEFIEYGGEKIVSRPDEGTLKKISELTGGVFIPGRDFNLDPKEIYNSYYSGSQSSEELDEEVEIFDEYYRYFLAPALIFILFESLFAIAGSFFWQEEIWNVEIKSGRHGFDHR